MAAKRAGNAGAFGDWVLRNPGDKTCTPEPKRAGCASGMLDFRRGKAAGFEGFAGCGRLARVRRQGPDAAMVAGGGSGWLAGGQGMRLQGVAAGGGWQRCGYRWRLAGWRMRGAAGRGAEAGGGSRGADAVAAGRGCGCRGRKRGAEAEGRIPVVAGRVVDAGGVGGGSRGSDTGGGWQGGGCGGRMRVADAGGRIPAVADRVAG